MKLKIQKRIPIPPRASAGRKRTPITIAAMSLDVGDSFWIGVNVRKAHARLETAKKDGRRFVARTEGDGTRIWRISDSGDEK